MDMTEHTTQELLTIFANVLKELRTRGVTRSHNNPTGDLGEYLVTSALELKMARKSNCGYDATDANGKRYEIKCRRQTRKNRSTQMGVVRGIDKFDYLIGVLLNEDFSVYRACKMPSTVVNEAAKHSDHVNGWILHLRNSVWELEGVTDITAMIEQAMSKLPDT